MNIQHVLWIVLTFIVGALGLGISLVVTGYVLEALQVAGGGAGCAMLVLLLYMFAEH